jgi:hypothetical protein
MEQMTSNKLQREAKRALRLAESTTDETLRQELLEIAAEFVRQSKAKSRS